MAKRQRPPSANRPPPSNHLLAALPRDDCQRIARSLDTIPLTLKQTLQKAGERLQHVYFPGGGVVSMVTVLADGSMVEVATIGREGVAGLPTALGSEPAHSETMVQGASPTCWRMSIAAFSQEMDRRGAFHELVTRYNHALVGVIMQSTACNAIHSVEQRLARWLLMAHDRMEANDFPLTQEFLAMMLGVSRPMVTIVAGTLQKAGLITYRRGHLTIVSRQWLEAASCECYATSTNLLQKATR